MNAKRFVALTLLFSVVAASRVRGEFPRDKVARTIGPVLAVPPATGLLIFEVMPRSQAEREGFRVGDVLTVYDGQPVTSLHELERYAKEAIGAGQKDILVLVRRGKEELEGSFDPAPLGLRLVAIRKNETRALWRPETRFRHDWESVGSLVGRTRWEMLMRGSDVVGWARTHFAGRKADDLYVMRTQSRIRSQGVEDKGDVIMSFRSDKYLSPRSIRIKRGDEFVLDFRFDPNEGGKLVGERGGVPVEAALPTDTVSSYLAGYAATMMPRHKGACLRYSSLEAMSLVAAPFADLYCLGKQKFQVGDRKIDTYRFEKTVFGATVAEYWVDEEGTLVRTEFANGFSAVAVTEAVVRDSFPDLADEFDPIEDLPVLQSLKAN